MQKKPEKVNIIVCLLIGLKREVKEEIVFAMKAKTALNVHLKQIHSQFLKPDESVKHTLSLLKKQ